jgi:hypothetical protein
MAEFDINKLREKPCKIQIICNNKILWSILIDRILSYLPVLNTYYLTYDYNDYDYKHENKIIRRHKEKSFLSYKNENIIVFNTRLFDDIKISRKDSERNLMFGSKKIYLIHNTDLTSDYMFFIKTCERKLPGVNNGECFVYDYKSEKYYNYLLKINNHEFTKYDLSTIMPVYYKNVEILTKEQKKELIEKTNHPSRVIYYLEKGYEVDDIFC